jgi:hypothetical protein
VRSSRLGCLHRLKQEQWDTRNEERGNERAEFSILGASREDAGTDVRRISEGLCECRSQEQPADRRRQLAHRCGRAGFGNASHTYKSSGTRQKRCNRKDRTEPSKRVVSDNGNCSSQGNARKTVHADHNSIAPKAAISTEDSTRDGLKCKSDKYYDQGNEQSV